jgi:hypothetical protein
MVGRKSRVMDRGGDLSIDCALIGRVALARQDPSGRYQGSAEHLYALLIIVDQTALGCLNVFPRWGVGFEPARSFPQRR